MKQNLIYNMAEKMFSISEPEFHEENIKVINTIFLKNDYPPHVIRKNIEKAKMNVLEGGNSSNGEKMTSYHSITYIKNLTEEIVNILKPEVSKRKTGIAYCINNKCIHYLPKRKPNMKIEDRSNVVYRIEFTCKKAYIGTTKRRLGIRIKEHSQDIANGDDRTGLAAHILESGHNANFEKVSVLANEKCYRKKFYLEALHTMTQDDNVNIQKEGKLIDCYDNVLQMVKRFGR